LALVKKRKMAQSENCNESNTGKKSLSDEEVNGGIKGKLLSMLERIKTSTSKKK